MSISFRRIKTVAPGDKITSTQHNNLADGIADRQRSGLGDFNPRVWYKAFSLFRTLRNPDGDAFPAIDEWFSHYCHIPYHDRTWPEDGAGPGDPRGPNVLNPMMAFIYGSEDYNLEDETRLNWNGIDGLQADPFTTPAAAWAQGKVQRGAIDLEAGHENAPALQAAGWQRRIFPHFPYLVKYGGFVPEPVSVGTCQTDGVTVIYLLPFSPLKPGLPPLSFNSVCPSAVPDDSEGDGVVSIDEGADAYTLNFQFSDPLRLPYTDYVLGPLHGVPSIAFTTGDQMEEVLARFSADFRGTEAQRANDASYRVKRSAFDFQKFLSSQHFLAPAQASTSGEELVVEGYPLFPLDSESPSGPSTFSGPYGVNYCTIRAGFALCGYRVSTTNASVPGSILVRVQNDPARVLLQLDTPAGTSERIVWLPVPPDFTGILEVVSGGGFGPDFTGRVELELAILEKRKPTLPDAYVLLRRSSAVDAAFENRGRDYASAPQISSRYFTHGCLFAEAEIPEQVAANTNTVYEAARTLLRDRLRFVKRESLRGYAVENGKSVLWFSRKVNLVGGSFDIWDGIAPPLEPMASGKIQSGVRYRVTLAPVTYHNVAVAVGDEFTGQLGVTTFTTDGGEVHQIDGIIITAPPDGATNEWLLFMTFNTYNDSEGSAWKPENYGDIIPFLHNRCHLLSWAMQFQTDIATHLGGGAATDFYPMPMLTVAPSAFNYVGGLNNSGTANFFGVSTPEKRSKFFKSCPLYPPDYEIESAQMDGDQVKLTFKTRFRNTGEMPGDLARGADYTGFDYRTDENALWEYLYKGAPCGTLLGDMADAGDLSTFESAHGSCQPRFYFSKVAEKVWAESPDTDIQDPLDTRLLSDQLCWSQFQLDAACEGYVDPQALQEGLAVSQCGERLPCYLFENLCYQIDGTFRSFQFLRPDLNPGKGYGPMPNTTPYAQLFNNVARGFNLLDTVPVEVPITGRTRKKQYVKITPTGGIHDYEPDGSSAFDGCPGRTESIRSRLSFLGTPEQTETPFLVDDWTSLLNVEAVINGHIYTENRGAGDGTTNPVLVCEGGVSLFQTIVSEIRYDLEAAVGVDCLLDNLLGLMAINAFRVNIRTETIRSYQTLEAGPAPGAVLPTCGVSGPTTFTWPDSDPIYVRDHREIIEDCETIAQTGAGSNTINFELKGTLPDAVMVLFGPVPLLNVVCSNGPTTTKSMNPALKVLSARVPLV